MGFFYDADNLINKILYEFQKFNSFKIDAYSIMLAFDKKLVRLAQELKISCHANS